MVLWSSLMGMLPFHWAEFGFMQMALLAVLVVAPLFAFLGCMVVNNQMAFFSDAIGHSALTGIAIGVILGVVNPVWSMTLFSLCLAVGITLLRKYGTASADTIIGIVMSFTVATGIVILSRGGGFSRYSRYLIGDLLSITPGEIGLLVLAAALFLLLWAFFFNKIFLVSINMSLARSRRIPVWLFQTVFAIVTAMIVTVSIPWVGILVINAMLILPAAAARNCSRSVFEYHWFALGTSVLAGVSGLILSFYWSTATGATIVIALMGFYVFSLFYGRLRGVK